MSKSSWMGRANRVFINCFRNREAFEQSFWLSSYNTRHPAHKAVLGDKARRNYKAIIFGVSSND